MKKLIVGSLAGLVGAGVLLSGCATKGKMNEPVDVGNNTTVKVKSVEVYGSEIGDPTAPWPFSNYHKAEGTWVGVRVDYVGKELRGNYQRAVFNGETYNADISAAGDLDSPFVGDSEDHKDILVFDLPLSGGESLKMDVEFRDDPDAKEPAAVVEVTP